MSASFSKWMESLERITAAAVSISWPDHDWALVPCGGGRLVGDAEKTFIYRPTHSVPEWFTGELFRNAEASESCSALSPGLGVWSVFVDFYQRLFSCWDFITPVPTAVADLFSL